MIEQLNTLIDSLSLDHKRGASEIVRDAAELFVEITLHGVENSDAADHLFQRAVRRLAKGQPTMAPVLNLLNRLCKSREEKGEDWKEINASIPTIYRQPSDYVDQMKQHLSMMPRATRLIAFSNSSTVAQIITTTYSESGWPEHILCGEGRPVMEGVVLAKKLTAAGLDVTLFTDAALMSKVVEADAVWVGGDSLSRDGLVNKVGSRALAMLCQMRQIPFISVMSSDKLLPTALAPFFYSVPQNPREIGGDDSESLNIHNEYYETLPLECVTSILTEDGVFAPEVLITKMENEPLSPLFARLVKR